MNTLAQAIASGHTRARPSFWRSLRALMLWLALALLLTGGGGGVYFYLRADQELRIIIQRKLSERYPDLDVQVGEAKILQGEGIRLRRISLIDRRTEVHGQRQELIFVDEILLRCQPKLPQLVQGQLTIQHVAVRGATLRATRFPDGHWDLEQLAVQPSAGDNLPPVTVESSVLEVIDRAGEVPRVMRLEDVQVSATPIWAPRSAEAVEGSSESAGRLMVWDIQAGFRNTFLRRGTVRGRVAPQSGVWELQGQLEELVVSAEFLRSVPEGWGPHGIPGEQFEARTLVNFQVFRQETESRPRFAIDGQIISGRWEDGRLPQHLTDLRGSFRADPNGWSAHDLQATFGDSQLTLSCGADGLRADSPLWITGQAERIPLSAALAERLPPAARRLWDKYQPIGTAHAQFNIEFDGRTWRPQIEATMEDVSITWYRFPYPLQHCRGKLSYTPSRLQIDAVGLANAQQVAVRADIQNPGPSFVGRVDVQSLGWIPWEDAITQALDSPAREVVESLGARGQVQVAATMERKQPGGTPGDLSLNLFLRDGWISFDQFPYPLQNVSGRIVLADGQWTFQSLEGRNGSCVVQGVGTCRPGAFGETALYFSASDVPLENELRDALPGSARKMWNDMAPRGSIDKLRVEWHKRHDGTPGQLQVVLQELAAQPNRGESTPVTLQPVWLPYRWEQIQGTLAIENGGWKLSRFRGHHADTTVDLDATGATQSDGSWTADIQHLNVERLTLNRELLAALPTSLSRSLQHLDERGQFTLQGNVQAVSDGQTAAPRWTWDLLAQIDQAALAARVPISNIFGQARLAGVQQGAEFRMHALLDLESVMVRQIQLVNLKGSLLASPAGVILGNFPGSNQQGIDTTPLTCNLLGGELEVQATVQNEPNMPFQTRFILRDGDLRSTSRELALTEQSIDGKVSLDVGLTGSLDGWHTLQGSGNMRLREATVYELPQMVALLKLLEARAPDRTAFTSSDSTFQIRGDRVYFDQIDLYGDAITLKGDGEVDLQRQLNLQFYTIMGREARWVPAVRPLLGEASRQFLLIRVQGTVDQPVMTREVLPGLNEGLRRFFPELVADNHPEK
ncbi:MAG: AsmA-like C-terminal region-containing protein [Pirellulales bacterium]